MESFSREALEYSAMQDLRLRKGVSRKWFELTDSAKQLLKAKDTKSIVKAEKLLSKALKITLKEPLARASTCHDLGVLHFSYHTELPGGTYLNLSKAIQYFNRAINTPQRQHISDRYASSISQLAATYRRAANDYLWPDNDVNCLEKARSLHSKAIDILEISSVPQAIKDGQLSIMYFNLASVLFDQGSNHEACKSQAKSVELYLAYQNYNLPPFMNVMSPNQALGLSFARLMHFSSYQRHKDMCEVIFNEAPKFGLDPLKFMLINPMLDIAKPEQKIDYLVRTAEREPSNENINKLFKKQSDLMSSRYSCKSDSESDYLASLVQRVCSGLARILVKKGDSITALRLLENCSALRFCESANKYWQIPSEALSMALQSDLFQLGAVYFNLNELALMLEHVNEVDVKLALKEVHERSLELLLISDVGDSTVFFSTKRYSELLELALNSHDTIGYLRQKSSDCLNDFHKLEYLMDQLDPEFSHRRSSDNSVDIHHFERALREHPDLTLIRIDIESNYSDALILVATLVNNKLMVTGYNIALPQGLVNDIGKFAIGETDRIRTWVLDFINWREILPIGCKKIGLLTSFFASQIPWVATGLKGEELFSIVDDVSWLPSVLYLCNHVTHFNKRTGTKCVNGGDTRFHNIANQHTSDLLNEISKSDFLDVIRSCEVVSYYGHCVHELPNRPSLKTKLFDLHDLELVNYVGGMERIEFWACQSGSNIPLSVFSIPVNEAFGFDMRMIEWGAVSSIGSLWALPDIVTAHIKSHYDQLVNNGMSPSKALLSAQRWWVKEGARSELNKMRELGLSPYLNTLGCTESIDGLLGPMKTKESRFKDEIECAESLFLHPSSWAGLRFCGLSDKIKQVVFKDKVEITANEINDLKSLLAQQELKSGFISYE
ncbi:CHAT domain-containing protein [Aliivibrio fischeri]|uniref:CHAT domain-containing protein n=1 Tax=Aliivibrio fischeri TaxID=668 RepID=UPI0012D99282|nr:CHAT domain-containing protein [Aliivibrio fischeri]MUH96585.1 CHAT domain-containing protein [Aliivibrio fischeri]MUI63065.1 CHAT domain-containing protein [Aliivibrio fischeri]